MLANYEQLEAEALSRWAADSQRPWVRVGTALCGQAAGCSSVVSALREALDRHGVDARLSEVGCIGLCYAEPLVDVQLPGGARIFYGNFDPEQADELVEINVGNGWPVERLALGYLAPMMPEMILFPLSACGTFHCIPCGCGKIGSPFVTPGTLTPWIFTSTSLVAGIAL